MWGKKKTVQTIRRLNVPVKHIIYWQIHIVLGIADVTKRLKGELDLWLNVMDSCHVLQPVSKSCEPRRGYSTVHATGWSIISWHTSTIPQTFSGYSRFSADVQLWGVDDDSKTTQSYRRCLIRLAGVVTSQTWSYIESKKVGKDQELIQSSTNNGQGYHMGKWNLPKAVNKIQQRRVLFPGYNYRNSELVISQLLLW